MRLLIFLGLIYLGYRALKSWMLQGTFTKKTMSGSAGGELDDIMVKDPFCQIYFPKRDAVYINLDGKDLYFCSEECRDKYIASYSKK